MVRVLVLSKDNTIKRNVINILDKTKYNILNADIDSKEAFSYSRKINAEVVIVHSSFINNNYVLFDQLINNKRNLVIYLSSKFELGYLYSVIESPRFYLLNDLKYQGLNEILEIMEKNNAIIDKLEKKIDNLKDKVQEDKLVKQAKLLLINKGMTEEEAYKYILKKSMNERITKKQAAQKIMEGSDIW